MKTITELAAEARRTNAQMGDGFDYAIHTTVHSIIAIESEVTALRERLAAVEVDAEPTTEMCLAGMNAWDTATINARLNGVRLNWPDMMVVIYKAMHAARNPTKEG